MFNKNINKARAQTTLEYSVIISVIVAALLTMQVYIKRSLQGKLRSAADEIGQQYDPRNTLSDITTSLISDVTTGVESKKENGKLTTTTTVTINNQSETRYGDETVGPLGDRL
ncbi:hypothetical protein KKD20_06890 [Patescibacteria group bacterium]|nr:hypothetical protein [Patescibacteria group bacterium]